MSLAVVRCPGCRGASRVSADALGQMVGCPRCQMPFVAEEEIPVVPPVSRPAPPRAPIAPAVAPARRPPAENDTEPAAASAAEGHDPEHDPHARPVAGLPVSVLVGLALVPFGIPLLWRVAPFVTGQDAALSMAVPVSLAVAASALCLGVVYTIDWTAATRVKGVLMLVGLAYLSAAGLFFLKKDLMERIRSWGDDSRQWSVVSLNKGACQVPMLGTAVADKSPLLGDLAKIDDGRHSQFVPEPPNGPRYEYRVAVGTPNVGRQNLDDAWFARVGDELQKVNKVPPLAAPRPVPHANGVGREWAFEINRDATRVVRVYVIGEHVYYLHAEGPRLTSEEEEYGKPFFDRFSVTK